MNIIIFVADSNNEEKLNNNVCWNTLRTQSIEFVEMSKICWTIPQKKICITNETKMFI